MTMREEDPAFPTFGPRENSGMSLRDYFAGQALPAAVGALNSGGMLTVRGEQLETVAKYAYDMADAMLAERAK
jgi:hypothetical protein